MSRTGYARLSNEFWRNTKVRKLKRRHGMGAVGLFALIVAYCSDTLSDGYVSEDALLYQLDADEDMIAALCEVGMLGKTENGYVVHDYLLHQNSREQVEKRAEAHRKRQQEYRERLMSEAQNEEGDTSVTRHTDVSDASVTRHAGVTDSSPFNQEPITNNQYSSQVVEDVNVVDAHAREAAATPTGDDARREEALLETWLPTSDDLAHAASLGVDGKTLADKMRDKLTRKGFDACGIHRRTPQALDAMFRTWIEHEAQWAGERPKPVKPPAPIRAPRPQHSWCGPEVRAIMNPYRDRFPEPNPGDVGPGQAWFEACKDVAQRLDDGENETSIIEWADATYGTLPATTATNTS